MRHPDETNAKQYDIRHIASLIAEHSQKHLEENRFSSRDNKKFGEDLGISNTEQLSEHIHRTIIDENTIAFKAINDRAVYYNEYTNTIVIVNSSSPNGGTCYRDKRFAAEFNRLEKQDEKQGGSPERVRGGYYALYPERLREREGEHRQPSPEPEPTPKPAKGKDRDDDTPPGGGGAGGKGAEKTSEAAPGKEPERTPDDTDKKARLEKMLAQMQQMRERDQERER